MAGLFAVLITLTFGLSYNSIQSNAICGALNKAFGFDPLVVGCIITAIALFIAFGGIHRIARVSSILVPIMAIGYFILAFYVVIMNINMIPHVLRLIVENAFGFEQVAGGGLGMTIMVGVKRGLFSNEAGEGSAPNVAATADVSHPVKQGLIQALGVFTDTLVVCSCTAFLVLVSGLYTAEGLEGIQLTQASLELQVGSWGTIFVAIALFLFAFSSIIGNYYYGEANIRFLTDKKWVLTVFRILSGGAFVFLGAVASFEFVWNLGDLFMALVTLCNLIALAFLSKYAFKLLKNYRDQRRRGIDNPVFHRSDLPEIADELDSWD
jgi:AGCS family alanine or glycine:cation symporter